MLRFFLAALGVAALLVSCTTRSKETAMSAPVSLQPLDLQQLLDTALREGRRQLDIPPGHYRLPGPVRLSKVTGFTLTGYGATVAFPPAGEQFVFAGCRQLEIRGLSVDCDPLPFTQATITRVSEDCASFEYEVHAGYPPLTVPDRVYGKSGIFAFAPDTRRWCQDIPDLYPTKSEILDATHGRVTLSGDLPGYRHLRPGLLVAFKNPGSNAFLFRGCDGVRLHDVTVLTAPCAGYLFRSCTGPIELRRCAIRPGPAPAGATQPRLLSTVADGFNVGYSRQGPVVEDCDFSYMGDDAVNLHGTIVPVAAVTDPRTFWVARTGSAEFQAATRPGDPVRFLDPRSFAVKASAAVAACELVQPDAALETRLRQAAKAAPGQRLWCVRFTLAEAVSVTAGDKLELPAVACPGFVFRRNYFHDHRARGLRLGAGHGVIADNRFERLKSTAISLGPHAIHSEGGWVEDVTVQGNSIRDVCFDDRSLAPDSYHAGAIVIQHFLPDAKVPYPQANRGIRILDNCIEWVGGSGILATSAADLTIRGNRIDQTQQRDCDHTGEGLRLGSRAAINLNYCTDAVVADSRFGPRGPYCRAELLTQPAQP